MGQVEYEYDDYKMWLCNANISGSVTQHSLFLTDLIYDEKMTFYI